MSAANVQQANGTQVATTNNVQPDPTQAGGGAASQENNTQVVTGSWRAPVDRVAEMAKLGIKSSAPALAECCTEPCGATGQTIRPIVTATIMVGTDAVVDAAATVVKTAFGACQGEEAEQTQQSSAPQRQEINQ